MGERELLTQADMAQLIENGRAYDPHPVVMLFLPYTRQCWLLSEVRPHDHDLAYGLHDDGRGTVREGEFHISELTEVKGKFKSSIERDHEFQAEASMKVYVDHSLISGNIVTPTAYFRR